MIYVLMVNDHYDGTYSDIEHAKSHAEKLNEKAWIDDWGAVPKYKPIDWIVTNHIFMTAHNGYGHWRFQIVEDEVK